MVNDTNLSQLFFTLKHSRTPVIFSVPLSPTNNNAQVYGNLPRLLAWTRMDEEKGNIIIVQGHQQFQTLYRGL